MAPAEDVAEQVVCTRHGTPTRITCAECATPICPKCLVRTGVGFKCPVHGQRVETAIPTGRTWVRRGVFAAVVVLLVVAFVQKPRPGRVTGVVTGCPTRPAADVGIGPQAPAGIGGTWVGMRLPPVCGRILGSAVWTGTELIVWGGVNCAGSECPSPTGPRLADGAAYRPAADSWRTVAASPLTGRSSSATAWTGREMVVWGGETGSGGGAADGAAYDPASNRWRLVAKSPLTARAGAVAAWTGRELVVWGGAGGAGDGAAYNPEGDAWRPIAPSPLAGRERAVSVWTGRELVIWGGLTSANVSATDGAAYDPAADSWRALAPSPLSGRDDAAAVWTGSEVLVWGGFGGSPPADGADPEAVPTRRVRVDPGVVTGSDDVSRSDGAAYDPVTDRWRLLPPSPISGRSAPASAWTGRELLVWGGFSDDDFFADGAAYEPAAGRWRRLARSGLTTRTAPAVAWTGRELVVWGGLDASLETFASAADGGRWRP